MDKRKTMAYIEENYGAEPEYLWQRYPNYAVYRHTGGKKKWFAAVMEIPAEKIGLDDDRMVDIIDLKCDPVMITSLIDGIGIFPGYHMNRSHWITILLEGNKVPFDRVCALIDMSYQLTK